jgi:cbb3-type cytochrome oxidase subunit 3
MDTPVNLRFTLHQAVLLKSLVFFHLLGSSIAIEKHGKAPSRAHQAFHELHLPNHNVEVALDRRGISHIRREEDEEISTNAMHSQHSHHRAHRHHRKAPHKIRRDQALLQDDPNVPVSIPAVQADSGHHVPVQQVTVAKKLYGPDKDALPPSPHATNYNDAAQQLDKIDRIVRDAEEKSGLPDSTKTLPPTEADTPTDEEQEGNALMWAAISLIVLTGVFAAGWTFYFVRRGKTKANEKAALAEGEGEQEGAGEDEQVEFSEAEPQKDEAAES